jgi:hypothetical protein
MAFKVSEESKRRTYDEVQAARRSRRGDTITRLRERALEDPEGPWAELLEEMA